MIKINLLPKKKIRKKVTFRGSYLFGFLLIVNFLALFLMYQRNAMDVANYEKMIEATKKEMVGMEKIRQEYQAMQKDKAEIERRLAAINALKEGRVLSARLLYDLASVVKENIWLKNFRKNENQFEIEGRSVESESISDFIETISQVPYIKDIELRRVEDVNEEGIIVKRFIIRGTTGL